MYQMPYSTDKKIFYIPYYCMTLNNTYDSSL